MLSEPFRRVMEDVLEGAENVWPVRDAKIAVMSGAAAGGSSVGRLVGVIESSRPTDGLRAS